MKISKCELFHAQIPLDEPYSLSFRIVTEIDLFLLRLTLSDGRQGVSEAVPLPGYTQDTKDSLFSAFKIILKKCIGIDTHDLESEFANQLENDVFAFSALITAAEMSEKNFKIPKHIKVPLVAPVSASNDAEKVLSKALSLYDSGYQTIKLKTGRNIDNDCLTVKKLLSHLPESVLLRIDANQGYNYSQAMRLFDELDHPGNSIVELVEQPLPAHDWDGFQKLSKQIKHIPLMLDESILCDDDITRAAAVGADLVKLKLFKQGGSTRLQMLARQAHKLNMGVVLGNGVSSEVGNLIEAAIYTNSDLFSGASEGNGFIKLMNPVLLNKPTIDAGYMVWHNPDDTSLDKLVDYNSMNLIASA